jgi:outer membrane protein TolC
LDNRLDLRVARGQVFDAQRFVVVKADALRAELTLLGSTESGSRRTVATAGLDDARIRANQAESSGLLTLDLAVERTAERNDYRNSLISLEQTIRFMSTLEDQVKLDVRNRLRTLLSARESLQIQAESVRVAEKRVISSNLFLQAGRVQIRDVLEAQDDLVSAQNSLTAAVVRYRVTELQLQRDMGMLKVNEKGLWREFDPEEVNNAR